MNGERAVRVVVPHGVHDPLRPSGGNTYDRRLCAALAASGWSVRLEEATGDWPGADRAARDRLAGMLAAAPDGEVVLVDGLVALAAPEALVPASRRLRTVVLVHMLLSTVSDDHDVLAGQAAVLGTAAAVVTTSGWTRRWLIEFQRLDPTRVHVAAPGVDPAPRAPGSDTGGALLCVGAVTPVKGHDVLVAALAEVADLAWRCTGVGALDVAPSYVEGVHRAVRAAGLGDRVELTGTLTGPALEAAYAAADLLVLPSRAETYGMVVTEALARGLPVLACEVGGVPEALGATPDGRRPGLLTPAADPDALTESLRCWLTDPDLRHRLRTTAGERRAALTPWAETALQVARVLEEVAV